MTLDQLIVTITGIAGIIFTYWFFLMKKETTVIVADSVDITIEGGYTPNVISIPVNKATNLNFFRKDPSSCLEEVVLPDFKVKKYLPVNKTTTITITPMRTGEFTYSCGMNMFHGKILVTE